MIPQSLLPTPNHPIRRPDNKTSPLTVMRPLVITIDDLYATAAQVLLHSLYETTPTPEHFRIFIVYENSLRHSTTTQLKAQIFSYGWTPFFIDAEHYIPDDLPPPKDAYISRAAYYRLFAASFLPADIESAAYLDVDTLVTSDISTLLRCPLNEPIAAVDSLRPAEALRLHGPKGGSYFQSGVLLLNLSAWRAQNHESLFNSLLQRHYHELIFPDQDILNIAFRDQWKRLDVWYNLGGGARHILKKEHVLSHGKILHYTGKTKPWHKYSRHYERQLWYQAYQRCFGEPFPRGTTGWLKDLLTRSHDRR